MTMEHDDLELVLKAVEFAARKHKDQRRKDVEASPYVNHPIAVANILCSEGQIGDVSVICGALLHDTLEDTATTPEELASEFGTAIRRIVEEVSDDKGLPKEERKRLQIAHAARISDQAKLVKLGDKIANLRDVTARPPDGWSLQRKQAYFDWARAVVDNLRGVHPGLEAVFDATYVHRPDREKTD